MSFTVDHLQFGYKNAQILKGISFHISSGECVCCLGKNGAGKTTLFRCILGLLRNYRGSIKIKDQEAKNMSAAELARKIAYIPQSHSPTFNYDVIDTVVMGATANLGRFRSPGPREEEEAYAILERLGIGYLADRGYAKISGGERQLVLIARALMQKTNILIMDEPTANLDYGNQVRVMKQVVELARQGYLIFLSIHNPEHALHYASRVLVLIDGLVAMDGPAEKILSSEAIQRIYGIEVEVCQVRSAERLTPVCIPC